MLSCVGAFRFPEGDAAASRVLGIGKALRALGYDVLFAGSEASPRPEDINSAGEPVYQGFHYYPQHETRTSRLGPIARLRRYFAAGANTEKFLRTLPAEELRGVILYNGLGGFHIRVGKFCRERRIPFLCDVTEWYEPRHCVGGSLGLHRWDVELTMRYWAPRCHGVLAISSYLERYFAGRGCRVVRVPPLVDLKDVKWPPPAGDCAGESELRLVFAGQAGKKDYVVNALRGLAKLGEEGKKVRLEVVGPSREELSASLGADAGLMSGLERQVEFSGRLPHREALKRVAACDFSLILRPPARYAMAGFPTKLVESLSCGVPVMANLTSDIASCVRDGVEGFILPDWSADALAAGLKRALALTGEQHREMRANARTRAAEVFDYRNWVSRLDEFMAAVLREPAPGRDHCVPALSGQPVTYQSIRSR